MKYLAYAALAVCVFNAMSFIGAAELVIGWLVVGLFPLVILIHIKLKERRK